MNNDHDNNDPNKKPPVFNLEDEEDFVVPDSVSSAVGSNPDPIPPPPKEPEANTPSSTEQLNPINEEVRSEPAAVRPSIFDTPPSPHPVSQEPKFKLPEKKIIRPNKKIMAVLVAGLIGAGAVLFVFNLYQKANQAAKLASVRSSSERELNDVISRVSKIVEFKIPETPSQIANITDVSRLAKNSFFDKAENGDVVLIYPKNREAVLFRPSTNKVVAIGPITHGQSGLVVSPGSPDSEEVAGAAVESFNPTPTPGSSITPTVILTISPAPAVSIAPTVSPTTGP